MSLGSAICGGMRNVVCPMSNGTLNKFVGCVFQWGLLASVKRSFMVRAGVGSLSNLNCIIELGVMFWHMRYVTTVCASGFVYDHACVPM